MNHLPAYVSNSSKHDHTDPGLILIVVPHFILQMIFAPHLGTYNLGQTVFTFAPNFII